MKKQFVVLDGGMGRELKRMGAPFSQPLWSAQALIESPSLVRKAHQNFIDAGAEIITVNSYACVPFHLGETLYQSKGAELAQQAAVIANAVAKDELATTNRSIAVAGAIPPVLGSYRPDLFDSNKAKGILDTLVQSQEPYVDLWLAETISSLKELDAIQQALSFSPKKKYYAFTLQDSPNGKALLRSGESVSEAVEQVCSYGGEGILFNCSIPEVMGQAIKLAKELSTKLETPLEIGAYANSFGPIKPGHKANDSLNQTKELSAEEYLVFAKQWHELGATIIGGCCGIHPEHIQAIADWKREH
ncbi:homocysteine S-methyltransferase family protein [Agarivorans sp. 1_MG-2023]|uniref:homocysteine S-methyltransferase family protein n=1 Tax=Agarivorans sp. 1_MG-2023 TaxID=3062634 RepID=UPI0026E476F2|nr:homocysteine S-methyltransferase family protein [Agarivorans sp. 1_MG-2023]MDO6765575.1 homocysteine S-methyltransferase family protein [Agarivorans sp. 1_MG-2023]